MSAGADHVPTAAPRSPREARLARILSYSTLAVLSVVHSVLFTGLMICAFALGGPQPATFVFGLTHGVLYMVMAVACGLAARVRTVPLVTALVVIVVGAMAPYFGTFEFLRGERNRRRAHPPGGTPAGSRRTPVT